MYGIFLQRSASFLFLWRVRNTGKPWGTGLLSSCSEPEFYANPDHQRGLHKEKQVIAAFVVPILVFLAELTGIIQEHNSIS